MKLSKTEEGIRTASPTDIVPFMVAVGFDLLVIFEEGSRFLLVLVYISKTSGIVVMY